MGSLFSVWTTEKELQESPRERLEIQDTINKYIDKNNELKKELQILQEESMKKTNEDVF